MDTQHPELQKAIEFVRQTFADKKTALDYSPASVKHLDTLFDNEYKDGKLKRPEGSFAKYQGLIMIGISGYLAEVILKHTVNTKLLIDDNDSNWYINFMITGNNNRAIQPGKVILSRIQDGNKSELYKYVLYAINYFGGKPGEKFPMPENKPWWKFWEG